MRLTDYPALAIRCTKHKAEAGEPCMDIVTPVVCAGRIKAAQAIFGKWKFKNGKYMFV